MIIGIYKITNKINNKSYIGQSVNIKRRWRDEVNRSKDVNSVEYDKPLSRAFRKYGVDNFDFSIIEECPVERLNERESYWADYYNTYVPNGYNVATCGDYSKTNKPEWFDKVIELLLQGKTNKEIANEIGTISWRTVSDFNCGACWKQPDLDYPIRKKIIYNNTTHNLINQPEQEEKKEVIKPSKEELDELIRKNLPNISADKLGEILNVAGGTVRRWLREYGLKTITEYKKELKPKKEPHIPRKVIGINLKTNEVVIFNSCYAASMATCGHKKNDGHIKDCCDRKRKTANGYYWEWLE